jgi:hypothetical protein
MHRRQIASTAFRAERHERLGRRRCVDHEDPIRCRCPGGRLNPRPGQPLEPTRLREDRCGRDQQWFGRRKSGAEVIPFRDRRDAWQRGIVPGQLEYSVVPGATCGKKRALREAYSKDLCVPTVPRCEACRLG